MLQAKGYCTQRVLEAKKYMPSSLITKTLSNKLWGNKILTQSSPRTILTVILRIIEIYLLKKLKTKLLMVKSLIKALQNRNVLKTFRP